MAIRHGQVFPYEHNNMGIESPSIKCTCILIAICSAVIFFGFLLLVLYNPTEKVQQRGSPVWTWKPRKNNSFAASVENSKHQERNASQEVVIDDEVLRAFKQRRRETIFIRKKNTTN
ncbi:uncharacterized protein [Parasteatoda tepidariorum]|uniref:uncharacterized protein n=1 Tax=Parasteatoda tepidariorum TaxID=114398 RepID=UPI0039BD79FA